MALPMTLVIIAAEIDLSVESMAGLSCAVLGFLFAAGVPIWIGVALVLVIGALGGLLNGLLVARGGLPSLVVTLGTLALFRGIAQIVLGPTGVSDFPPEFTTLGFGYVPGTLIPWPFVIFLTLALILGVVLHRTWIGRQVYAVGKSAGAARFSGVRVDAPAHQPVHADRHHRGARRRHPHGAPLDRPRRRGTGHDPDSRDGRAPRRRQHLRRPRHHPGCRPGRARRRGDAERTASRAVSPWRSRASPSGCSCSSRSIIPTFAHQAKSAIDRARRGRPPPAGVSTPGEPAIG